MGAVYHSSWKIKTGTGRESEGASGAENWRHGKSIWERHRCVSNGWEKRLRVSAEGQRKWADVALSTGWSVKQWKALCVEVNNGTQLTCKPGAKHSPLCGCTHSNSLIPSLHQCTYVTTMAHSTDPPPIKDIKVVYLPSCPLFASLRIHMWLTFWWTHCCSMYICIFFRPKISFVNIDTFSVT